MTLYLLIAAFWVVLIASSARAAAKQAPAGARMRAAATRIREFVIFLGVVLAAALLTHWLSPNPPCFVTRIAPTIAMHSSGMSHDVGRASCENRPLQPTRGGWGQRELGAALYNR